MTDKRLRPITIEGREFGSRREAADFYGVSNARISVWVKNGKAGRLAGRYVDEWRHSVAPVLQGAAERLASVTEGTPLWGCWTLSPEGLALNMHNMSNGTSLRKVIAWIVVSTVRDLEHVLLETEKAAKAELTKGVSDEV